MDLFNSIVSPRKLPSGMSSNLIFSFRLSKRSWLNRLPFYFVTEEDDVVSTFVVFKTGVSIVVSATSCFVLQSISGTTPPANYYEHSTSYP